MKVLLIDPGNVSKSWYQWGMIRVKTNIKPTNGALELFRKKTEKWFLPQKWWHIHKVSEVMKHVPDGDGVVLDLGCGCGDMFVPLQERGKTVVALDNDPVVIEYLKSEKDLHGVQLVLEDVASTKLLSNSIDVVLLLDVLEHLTNPGKCLTEINRILKPNGTVIITTPHKTFLWNIIWSVWTILMPYGRHDAFSKTHVVQMLKKYGAYSCDIHITHFGCLIMLIAKKKETKR